MCVCVCVMCFPLQFYMQVLQIAASKALSHNITFARIKSSSGNQTASSFGSLCSGAPSPGFLHTCLVPATRPDAWIGPVVMATPKLKLFDSTLWDKKPDDIRMGTAALRKPCWNAHDKSLPLAKLKIVACPAELSRGDVNTSHPP